MLLGRAAVVVVVVVVDGVVQRRGEAVVPASPLLHLLLLLLRLHGLEDVDDGVMMMMMMMGSLRLDLLMEDESADLGEVLDEGELTGWQLRCVNGGDGEQGLQAVLAAAAVGRIRTGGCSQLKAQDNKGY